MTDLEQRGYLERHAPANLEFDQVPMRVEIRISGSSRTHRLYTNGRSGAGWGSAWQVTFPDYFTCSSCYLHVTDRPMSVRAGSFTGTERTIPVTTYGEQGPEVERASRMRSASCRAGADLRTLPARGAAHLLHRQHQRRHGIRWGYYDEPGGARP